MKLVIRHGRVLDPSSALDRTADLFIANGKILGIDQAPSGFATDALILDASGLWVMPGLVDLSVHLQEPWQAQTPILKQEIAAAAKAGITSLVCSAATNPVLDEPGLVQMLKYRAQQMGGSKIYPLGALTLGLAGEQLSEMLALHEAGCVGFSQAHSPIKNTELLWRALQYAKTFNYTVWLHPQDPYLGIDGVANRGENALRLGLPDIHVAAETIALQTILELVRATGARVHIARISCARSVELIRAAKQEGLPVTCDVAIYHLHLTEQEMTHFNVSARLEPPLRSQRDQAALSQAVIDDTVDAICSDHRLISEDERMLPFAQTQAGASAMELLLPLALKWAQENQCSIHKVLTKLIQSPAQIAQIKTGAIQMGDCADLILFDPKKEWIVNNESLHSASKRTPFYAYPLMGKVRTTIIDGHIVYQE